MEAQSLLLMAPRRLDWASEELPEPAAHEVLLATRSGAISIGTELPHYRAKERSATPAQYPRMMGYESVGVVVACGAAVQRLRVGQSAFAFYGHRTHAIVSETEAIAVPDGISDALALLAILSCDVSKGIRKVAPLPEERALVMGAGAIGLLTLAMLRAYGVCSVDVVEPRAERRVLALALGAQQALMPQAAPTDEGYAIGFECSSRNAAFERLQRSTRPGGRICVLADGNIEPLTLTPAFHTRELAIIGSSDGWDYAQHAAWYFNLLREEVHYQEIARLFDYETTAGELAATFARMDAGTITPVKVLVRYE